MFSEQVRGINLTANLPKLKLPLSYTLLDPQRVALDVAQLA